MYSPLTLFRYTLLAGLSASLQEVFNLAPAQCLNVRIDVYPLIENKDERHPMSNRDTRNC